FRIEPAEIEQQLITHEQVKEAVVIARKSGDSSGENALYAYVVTKRMPEISALREHLAKSLPPHMIPSAFTQIENIPLTPNGKIDRKALPEPEILKTKDYTPPLNQREELIVEIWAKTLGIEKNVISTTEDFFQLGGDSFNAFILIANLQKELDVKLTIMELFSAPTVKELSDLIKGKTGTAFTSVLPTEKKEFYPLSSAQKRLYFIYQLAPKSLAYNMATMFKLEGNLDQNRMNRVCLKLVNRHESLRSSFLVIGSEPVQR
ncbi:MAG: hypothetical protein GY757_55145, partial [bacterium]|nr:hypothetical protein [bacterium]